MDVISAILETDNTAKEMMKSAEGKRDSLMSEARESVKSIESDIAAAAAKKSAEYEKQERANAEKEQKKLCDERDEAIARLDRAFEENSEAWEKRIFESIVNGAN